MKRGDTLFLFNFRRNRLHGVFEATGAAELSIEPYAFYGRYPAQVRVEKKIDCPWADKGALLALIKRKWIRVSGNGTLLFPRKLNSKFVEELYRVFLQIPPLPTMKNREPVYKAKDGHYVKSFAEKLIDEWLHDHLPYPHQYNLSVNKNGHQLMCDWYIQGIDSYLEYWETPSTEQTNAEYVKHRFYRAHSLRVTDIYENDLPKINEVMMSKLRATEPKCEFRKTARTKRKVRSTKN